MTEGPTAEGPRARALRTAVVTIVDEALAALRSPQIRGPFEHPSGEALGRSDYLRELSRWSRARVLRSKRTLGRRGVDEALEAASRLSFAADLLAEIEDAASPDAAEAAASAALDRITPTPSPLRRR